MRWLPWLSVHRPVTVLMIFLATMVLGAIAWTRIPLELMPGGFELNRLWIWVPYRDSTPQENENALVRPIEEQLATVEGLAGMNSEASSGSAEFELELHRSVGMDSAYNAVVDRMERAMLELPDDVDRYWVYRWNPADEPIIWAGMSFPETVEDPHWLANEVIARRIERVPGVGKVDIWGVDPKRVFIDFKLDALLVHNLNLGQVIAELGADNFQLASGRIVDRGQVRYVRSLARWEDVEALRRHPVGGGLKLEDIATVSYRLDPSTSIAHINGEAGAALAVNKESGANTVATAKAVLEAVAELEKDPRVKGTRVFTFFDQGALIQESLDNLLSSAITGGICAVIVLFAFLREWRMTLLIAAAMPITMLITVTIMYFNGDSLNLLSLMGLMLAVGMVVDNAIVVVEEIYARRQEGKDHLTAAVQGTNDVGMAIAMSTLTTMVVFLPVILMTGDADFSFFLGAIGFPVVFALATSLLVALLFTPLTTTFVRGRKDPEGREQVNPEPRWARWMTDRYGRSLHWILTHRTDALVGILAVLIVTFVLPFKAVECSDSADGNMNDFVVRYTMPPDFSYAERLKVVDTYEAWIDAHRESWGVRVHRTRVSGESNNGRTYVYLEEDPPDGTLSREEVVKEAQESLPQLPGVEAGIGWESMGGDEDARTLRLVLRGEETATLAGLSEEFTRRLKGVPGVLSVTDGLESEGGREMRLQVDRDASARSGVSAMSIGQTVGFALRGTQLPELQDGAKEIDVVARFQLEDRQDVGRLLDFPMWSPTTQAATPLRALVDTEVSPGLGSIHREDRVTAWPITVDLEQGTDVAMAWQDVDAALADVVLPRGYSWDKDGGFKDQAEDNEALVLAMGMSVIFVFLIMGVLFESLLLPLAIITTVPMALLGAWWTLYLTGTPLDPMGGIGVVVLIGVVVNNGIVLIDLVTRLRHEGTERTLALTEAGRRRIRPILMTALTTIFGVLPMAVGTSTFIGIPYAPLGRVVAGGMVAGTLLTLYLLPFVYSVLDDIRQSGRAWLAWVIRPRRPSDKGTAPAPGK